MKLVAISDTHDQHRKITIPECGILVVAGDFTCHREPIIERYTDFAQWLREQPAKHIVIVAGNHDTLFEKNNDLARSIFSDFHYLQDSGIEIEGIKFWGSPWTPEFAGWAFMKQDQELKQYWDLVPEDIDVLITHGPVMADARSGHIPVFDWGVSSKTHAGSQSLLDIVDRICPKIHIFGHIHDGHGKWNLNNGYFKQFNRKRDTDLYNVAVCNDFNEVKYEPTIIEI